MECYPRIVQPNTDSKPSFSSIQPDYSAVLTAIYNEIVAIRQDMINEHIWKIEQDRRLGISQWGQWTAKRAQNYNVLYEHTETYAGTTTTLDLDFLENVMLTRIEMIHNDNTAKTYQIRTYMDYEKNNLYNLLKSSSANQDTTWMQGYSLFMPAGSRLQFYFSNYTANKINSIAVGVEEV